MKQARTIKIIKSGSTERNKAIALPEEIHKAKTKKRCPDRIVNDWVREHQEQKQIARQVALNLLHHSKRPDHIKDKNSNR